MAILSFVFKDVFRTRKEMIDPMQHPFLINEKIRLWQVFKKQPDA